MNRILFVGLCLIGMAVFVLAKADINKEKQTEVKVAKLDKKQLKP